MTTLEEAPATTAIRPPDAGPVRRSVVVWASFGAIWVGVCAWAMVGWVTSDTDFAKAPILGPDRITDEKLIALRIFEALSVAVLVLCVWYLVVKPWRQTQTVGLSALLVVGGIFGFVIDGALNLNDYLFAWNAHSINYGVWAASLPFHKPGASSRYAEALLWGLPMYVYFCAGLGTVGVALARRLRARNPRISTASVLAVMWIGDFIFDFVVENTIIRTTDAYAFAQTQHGLTLWPGSQYQFPIYESILVAFVSVAFTAVRLSALDAEDGLSFIERGVEAFPARLHLPLRALSAIGFCAAVLIVFYHLPFNWLGMGGGSMAELPSYLLPG